MTLPVYKSKIDHHHWILHIQINLSTKFQLKLTILNFWTINFWIIPIKGMSNHKQNKTKKWKSPSNSTYSNKSWFQISASINNFDFSKQFSQTKILLKKNRKNQHHHWTLHIRFSLGIKFYFEETLQNFTTKFAQSRYIQSKTGKVSITIEFCIFELI